MYTIFIQPMNMILLAFSTKYHIHTPEHIYHHHIFHRYSLSLSLSLRIAFTHQHISIHMHHYAHLHVVIASDGRQIYYDGLIIDVLIDTEEGGNAITRDRRWIWRICVATYRIPKHVQHSNNLLIHCHIFDPSQLIYTCIHIYIATQHVLPYYVSYNSHPISHPHSDNNMDR